MSETTNDQPMDGGFVSAYDDNKDGRASQPVEDVQDSGLIVPDHTDVPEDDSAEPEDADVQHLASAEDVEASE